MDRWSTPDRPRAGSVGRGGRRIGVVVSMTSEMAISSEPSDASAWAEALAEVAVIGAGTMGEGIAQSFAEAGIAVRLIDLSAAALKRCKAQIASNVAQAERCGLHGRSAGEVLGLIRPFATDAPVEAAGDAGLVIETVPELLDLKRALFTELDRLPPDVVIGSNTSSLTVGALTEGMASAQRVVGLHYFNPAHIIPAVEIHSGEHTSDHVVACARAVLKRTGKTPFLVRKQIPGFIVNRLTGALMREIYHLLDEGVATPEELNEGVRASMGFRMAWIGPMESADFTGLDTGARVVAQILPQLSQRTEPSRLLLDKVARGDLGVKTGRGWLDYAGRTRAELLDERNEKLLRQLKSYREVEAKP